MHSLKNISRHHTKIERLEGNTKEISWRGPTHIRHHRTKRSRLNDLAPSTCAPLYSLYKYVCMYVYILCASKVESFGIEILFRSLTTRYITQTVYLKEIKRLCRRLPGGTEENGDIICQEKTSLLAPLPARSKSTHSEYKPEVRLIERYCCVRSRDRKILLCIRSRDRKILNPHFRFQLFLVLKEHVERPNFFSATLIYRLSFWRAAMHVLHFDILYPNIFFHPRAVVCG